MIYINKQLKDWDCGPIALLNALKWAGAKVTLKNDWKKACEVCKTDNQGTYDIALYQALKNRPDFVSLSCEHNISWNEIEDWCAIHDQAAILSYVEADGDNHFAFYDGENCPNDCLYNILNLDVAVGNNGFAFLLERK